MSKTPTAYAFDFKLRSKGTLYMTANFSVDSLVELWQRSKVKTPTDPPAAFAILENKAELVTDG